MNRANDPGGLASPEQEVGLQEIRQQLGNHIPWLNAQVSEQIGRLMHTVQQGAIGEAYRSIRSLPSSRQGDGRSLWVLCCHLLNQLIGAAHGEAFRKGNLLDGLNVLDGTRGRLLL